MKGPPSNRECAQAIRIVAEKVRGNDDLKKILYTAADRLEGQGHPKQNHAVKLYSVYENGTDKCLAFDLPAAKCAEILGITVGSFYTAIARGRDKWTIIKRYADEDDLDE